MKTCKELARASPHLESIRMPFSEHVLLVTAHPDDEAMFFAPALAALQRQEASVWVLCLSTGEP